MLLFKVMQLVKKDFRVPRFRKANQTTDKTIYRIASISKVVVGMGIMKLVEEGLLDINADIQDVLGFPIRNPKFPDTYYRKMLLIHTSSITDGYDDEDPQMMIRLKAIMV